MDRIRLIGGNELNGEIQISGAKNAALPLMIASLLTDEPLVVKDGHFDIPTRPGLGMALNHDAVRKYAAE